MIVFPLTLASVAEQLPEGSPRWALYFFLVCLCFLLSSLLTGYREGLKRQLYSLAALIGAVLAAILLGGLFAPLFEGINHPRFFLKVYGGVVAASLVFFTIYTFGRYLAKPSRKYEDEEERRRSRRGGLIIGGVFGILSVMILTSMIQVLGGFAVIAYGMFLPPKEDLGGNGRFSINEQPSVRQHIEIPGLITFFVKLKQSIDHTGPGKLLNPVDVVPGTLERSLAKAAEVIHDPLALDYLMNDPRVLELKNHPKVIEVMENPDVMTAFENAGLPGVLRHEKVRQLLDDEKVSELIATLPVEDLLDESLASSR